MQGLKVIFKSKRKLDNFQDGLKIGNYTTSPAKIKILEKIDGDCLVEITLREGKNRQVRRMCSAIGHPVLGLKELKWEINIGNLKVGDWRYLTEKEVEYLNSSNPKHSKHFHSTKLKKFYLQYKMLLK